jgi:hypothetical protein
LTIAGPLGEIRDPLTFNIPFFFNLNNPPICMELETEDNACLDSGTTLILQVQASPFLDPSCGTAICQVFDNESESGLNSGACMSISLYDIEFG